MSEEHSKILDDLKKQSPGVRAVFRGQKRENMQPVGDEAVCIGVERKLPPGALSSAEMLPQAVDGAPTDIVEVGEIKAIPPRPVSAEGRPTLDVPAFLKRLEVARKAGDLPDEVAQLDLDDLIRLLCPPRQPSLQTRWRPVQPGVSTGHPDITAGTWGGWLTDGNGNFFGCSNNHVWADRNAASVGDVLLQPGVSDGGNRGGADEAADLHAFEPIKFGAGETNLIDAALAAPRSGIFDPDVSLIVPRDVGVLRGLVPYEDVVPGQTPASKVGRTTGLASGGTQGTEGAVDVGYGNGKTARFVRQFLFTDISDPGDSGSWIFNTDTHQVMALLFAGSDFVTIGSWMGFVLDWSGLVLPADA